MVAEGSAKGLTGSTVAGCRVERLLGAGAMGEVYLATRNTDGRRVVVKFLVTQLSAARLLDRFLREGESLKKLRPHPCVVRVLDVGVDPRPCLILEYVDGQSLLAVIQKRGGLPAQEALRIARDIARGMDAVHAQGMLHRDLKPENVLLTPAGQVKIVDFGLVKDEFATALTEPGQLLGTGPYMAPERWAQEGPEGPAGDVFSLGATLYELVAGKPAFRGATLEDLSEAIEEGDYEPLRSVAPSASEDLELLVDQLLMPDPARRIQSMRECVDQLERLLNGEPCRVPCLASANGVRRLSLLRGRFFVVGSGPNCALRLSEPGVSPQHAQLRQVGGGFEVRDLGSESGTLVQGKPLTAPVLLADGDRLRLGQAELQFQNPREGRQAAPFLRDVERRVLAAPLIEALTRLNHPSVGLYLLDALAGDPDAWARDARALEPVLGPAGVAALGARLDASARVRHTSTVAQLRALTQQRQARSESDWFLWWDSVRLSASPQVVPPRTGSLTLRVTAGIAPAEFSLGDEGILLVGRDAKCHVRLDNRSVSRLHTTLLRLNERFLVRDEGRASGTLLNGQRVRLALLKTGDELTIGEVSMTVLASDPIPSEHADVTVHPHTFAALAEVGHPSIAGALVSRLDWRAHLAALSKLPVPVECDPSVLQEALRSLLQERATQALGLLPRLLGCELGADPAAWRAQLKGARAQLPPQVRAWPIEGA